MDMVLVVANKRAYKRLRIFKQTPMMNLSGLIFGL